MKPACSLGEAEMPRAIPKSHILRSQVEVSSRLPGLMSRCSTLAEWMNLSPRRIWYKKYLINRETEDPKSEGAHMKTRARTRERDVGGGRQRSNM